MSVKTIHNQQRVSGVTQVSLSIANQFNWHKFFTFVIMSLTLYKKKRRFDETPEPAGKEKSSKGFLRFVI